MSLVDGRGSGLRTYFGPWPDLCQTLYFTISENPFRTSATPSCGNRGNCSVLSPVDDDCVGVLPAPIRKSFLDLNHG